MRKKLGNATNGLGMESGEYKNHFVADLLSLLILSPPSACCCLLVLVSDNNPEYMYNYCRRSCGLCPPGSLESLLFCEDEFDDQCDKWVEDGLW
jgi:hypothetical protein